MINPINSVNLPRLYPNQSNINKKYAVDTLEIRTSNNPISISRNNNVTHISFKGKLNNPISPSIQMKVRGVSLHQKTLMDRKYDPMDRNIDKLANSNWYDGKKLDYEFRTIRGEEKILLFDRDFGEIGRVPDEITPSISKLLKKNGKDFEFQLSNVIAGTSKGASTTGLRVNLLYSGNDEKVKEKAERTYSYLLNSTDSDINDCVMLYQPETSPDEVLSKIFNATKEKYGESAVKEIKEAIDTISSEIRNPENKKILLLGHNLPDGDTIGCVLGMNSAIESTFPDKQVDCSIDDNLPGLYRDTLPAVKKIKKAKELNPNEKYDLVILMDIPSSSRFSKAYKKYIEEAKNVIYIDHHPYKYVDWKENENDTGLDIEKVNSKNMALIVPEVPAATQLVTIVAQKAGMLSKTMKSLPKAKQFVAGIISGTSSDTGCFARSANYTPEDLRNPKEKRPNFYPEGMSKWLISKLGSKIDKKWLRDNIVYDIPDKASNVLEKSSREKMIDYSIDSMDVYPGIGTGFVSIGFDEMMDIWKTAKKQDKSVTINDVQNSLKYSEVMGALRDSSKSKMATGRIRPYKTHYDDDKIAVLLIQDKKKGEKGEDRKVMTSDGIRMSFRSKDGTNYAEMLASLFKGGGHGGAAGARLDFDGVNFETPLAVFINGEIEKDYKKIFKTLEKNYEINHDPNYTESQKSEMLDDISVEYNEDGQPLVDLIADIATELRISLF